MKRSLLLVTATASFLVTACDKSVPPSDKQSPAASPDVALKIEAALPIASHLGFASRVPADADVFLAGYHADQGIKDLFEFLVNLKIVEMKELEQGRQKLEEIQGFVGDEAFLFVGGGMGNQLQTLAATYRDVMAASTGIVATAALEAAGNEGPPASVLDEAYAEKLMKDLMDAVEKDSRLQVPSLVMGWKPHAEKLQECAEGTSRALGEAFANQPNAKPASFEVQGVALSGFEVEGKEIFAKLLEEARKNLESDPKMKEQWDQIPQERFEQLLSALEQFRFTVASGTVDGRVVIYIGNGKEGFRLAATPEESLAATADLKWTHAYAEKGIFTAAYISDPMVRSVLPLLDSSVYWEQISKAIGPSVRDARVFRELFTELAGTEKQLAERKTSAFSAVFMKDEGLRIESQGGWADPDLDYKAPLRMGAPALAQKPAIRAHWVQDRERHDLAWKRFEIFGLLADAALGELKAGGNPSLQMLPEGALPDLAAQIRELNRAYREEFRAGIGDEVALVVDFKGPLPTIPGISGETIEKARIPRFVLVRDVKNRALLDAAGNSYAQVWTNLTKSASRWSGEEIPLMLPAQIESDRLVTWYPPIPFIGGDFVPGVSLNDKVWMLGTSKELAKGMATALDAPATGQETGLIFEIDFEPLWTWAGEIYKQNEHEVERAAGEVPDEMKHMANKEDLERTASRIRDLKGLSFRAWLEGEKPRRSLHLRTGAKE